MLVSPTIESPEAGSGETATGQGRPAVDDVIGVKRLAVDTEAALESDMLGEGRRALSGPGKEEVADPMEQRIDTESRFELVPRLGAQMDGA